MSLLVPDVGELTLLNYLKDNWGTLVIGLFKSNITPADGDTNATYIAAEADFPGYARQNLANWINAVSDGGGRALTVPDLITFTRNAGGAAQSVYGYFVMDAGPDLLWAERDPNAPHAMDLAGDEYVILPVLTLRSQP